jgi:tetratricopeptide (TPR) repeat protein
MRQEDSFVNPSPREIERSLNWALSLAETAELRGDATSARKYAQEAVLAGQKNLQAAPDNVWLNGVLGLAYAYLGRREEAVRHGERERSLWPVSADAYNGAFAQHYLARIYLRSGQPELAVDLLEDLLRRPCYLSPGWLRIDPEWTSLRETPRFRRLTEEQRAPTTTAQRRRT